MRHEPPAQFRAVAGASFTGAGNWSTTANLVVRPYAASDFEQLRQLLQNISQQARRFRFMSAFSEVPQQILDLLANVDHHNHLALVVEAAKGSGKEIVAEARYVGDHDDPSTCEFAITVADQWSGQGLGGTLLAQLEALAAANGFKTIRGEALVDNRAMVGLARATGYRVSRHPHDPGLACFCKDLANSLAARLALAA